MKCLRCVVPALLVIILVATVGCSAKKEQPGTPQSKPGTATQEKSAAPTASAQEKTDAQAAAAKVLAQFTAGDFSTLYKEAAPGFKQLGSEIQFVEKFQQARQKVGALKNPKETSFETIPNKGHILVYRLENDHYISDIRLTFARAKSGKMELAGLNQHDELKK